MSEDTFMKIGFIGLGSMGSGMARNLLKAGHNLVAFNRTRSKAEELRSLGAEVAESPGKAAAGAEALFTMLADDHALEDCIFGPGRALESLPTGSVHIGASTVSVALSRRLAAAHREKKQNYIAAPVFGRPEAAAAAKLFVIAAGPADQIGRYKVLLEAIGQKTFILGEDAATANVVKLTGNFLITTVLESLAESFSLVQKSGVDPQQFLDIMTSTLFGAPIYQNYGAMIAKREFEPVGFKLPLGLKDNRLVLELGEQTAVPLPMASLIRDRFLTAIAQGLSESDWSAISRISFRNAGLEATEKVA
jgi:3-hydroxyisobutyrate dehydrogenase-like beta-hydroxyacid dehydrogenase